MVLDDDVMVVNGAIRVMAEQCRQRAVADWIAFEENTLLLAGAEVDKKALELHQLATLKAGERAERALALKVTDLAH